MMIFDSIQECNLISISSYYLAAIIHEQSQYLELIFSEFVFLLFFQFLRIQ